jgi:hypothetical protein
MERHTLRIVRCGASMQALMQRERGESEWQSVRVRECVRVGKREAPRTMDPPLCTFMCMHMRVFMYSSSWICACIRLRCIYVAVCACVCAYVHVHALFMYVHVSARVSTCVCACVGANERLLALPVPCVLCSSVCMRVCLCLFCSLRNTPLHHAVDNVFVPKFVELLVANGADVTIRRGWLLWFVLPQPTRLASSLC